MAYGSNLHPARLQQRVASARLRGHAAVTGYDLRFHKRGRDGSGKCTLIEADTAVHVAVFELTRDDAARLDAIEGVDNGYAAVTIAVPGFGPCFTYLAEHSHIDTTLAPFVWYRSLVLAGCHFHGFPESYIGRVRAVPAETDPDRRRQAANGSLLRSFAGHGTADVRASQRRR
ncbi:MAG: gamma-glutamylcyclotransferase family protein [Pseudomonadota bacterium]